jgi:hypothetical protein
VTTVEDFYRARYLYQLSQGRGGGFKRRYCKAKFDRACMHAGAFDVLGKNLVNSHPYRLTGQVESDDWYRLRWKLQDPLPPLEQFASSSVTCSTTSAPALTTSSGNWLRSTGLPLTGAPPSHASRTP